MYVKYLERYGYLNFQIFESLTLMWPKAHQYSLKRAFICTIFKFDIQMFHYTIL